MGAMDPLLVCDPSIIWYQFTYPLSWSNECEGAEVLSDIPFISVGILMFGASTLFLVVKRVSLSTLSLFFSVLLAFVAAALDLGQTLADHGTAMNTTFRVAQTREALFALSIGFRFLFYWLYVAEPPRKDLSAATTQRAQRFNCFIFERHRTHNASWMRWGFPGKLVGAGLLVAIIILTALQIVWRVVPQFHQYGNVYATDAALELLVSFLFLLKLLLNTVTFKSVDDMSVHTFSECLAPVSGLLVNISIAIGNLLYFAFTESTVGRLLQAFEVFIIVVFVMVAAFLRHRDIFLATSSSQGGSRNTVFTLPEPACGSAFRITTPLIETPRMSTILNIAISNRESSREMFSRSARRSLNHVSSWLSSRIPRHHSFHGDEEVKLWNEKVKSDPPQTGDIDTEPRASIDTSAQASEARLEHLRDASDDRMSIISIIGQIPRDSRDVPQCSAPSQVRTSSAHVLSVSSPNFEARHAEMTGHPEVSLVHGLRGIQSSARASDSRTSLDELLRQQSQLEQSMEALRLFSTETFTNPSYSNSDLDVRSAELTRSPSVGQRTVCSEVSLSNFPVPPLLTTPVPPLPLSSSPSMKRIRGDRRVRLAAAPPNPIQDIHALAPPKILASLVDIPGSPYFNSIPHTPTEEESESLSAETGKFSHSDSGGMQYNVTSFIGDLATPGRSCQGSEGKAWWLTKNEPSFGTVRVEAGSDIMNIPPHMRVPRQLEAVANHSPSFCSSKLSMGDVILDHRPAEVMHYQNNDHSPHSLPVTTVHSPPIPLTDRVEIDMSGSDRNPQLIRGLTGVVRNQRTSIRRKPPPLATQSYAARVHNLDTTQAQVLAVD